MATTEPAQETFTVGKIVQVEARTWPGINKPGGVGRITQLHYSDNGTTVTSVDVRYTVVGGRERHVPIEHVEVAPEFDVQGNADSGDQTGQQLRDRSGLLGRCKRCGSLRADCGSCDWLEQERLVHQARNQPFQQAGAANEGNSRLPKSSGTRKQQTQISEGDASSSSSSSSSSDDVQQDDAEDIRRRKYRKLGPYWERLMNDSGSEVESSSSDESDIYDPMLARLAALTQRRRESKRRLAKKYATKKRRPKRRLQNAGLSSLETLPEPKVYAPRERTTESPTPKSVQLPNDTGQPPSPVLPSEQVDREIQVEDVGEPEVSSEDGLPPTPPLSPTQEEPENAIQVDSPEMGTAAPDVCLDLEGVGFIQPEGEAAAEHLPSDIVDRTQSVPYKQLPLFFDELLKELAREIIPDSKVALADFQRKTREARSRNDNDKLRRLKEQG